ncbi:MAG: IS3 family transposase [Bacteroidetes bacterium]|nr:IS3 family transposase [Bacteroidota bacterium]
MAKKKARSSILNAKEMIDDEHADISISRQCDLLNICRSAYYYKTRPAKLIDDDKYKRLIFEEYLKCPFYGYRKITKALKKKDYIINRKRVYRLMREMGIQAIYPKPNLSKPCPGHKKYPYLLRGLEINYPNQVWATDITYIKITGGFIYLSAIIDLYSRKVMSWGISNTQDTEFCIDVLEKAVKKYGKPEIFNSDQGSQFTSNDFTDKLKEYKIKISMDGKGRATDNIYIERLWRSLKYEDIFIKGYNTVKDCMATPI